jgi:uncharacterized coiled-coil DUF342 family protein
MQIPTDQAETSIPTETAVAINSLNLNRTFTVRRKVAKRSERWYQNTATPLSVPARKKPRLEEPLPTMADEAARKTASRGSSVGLPPPTADNDNDVITDVVMDTQPNATGNWTSEEDVKLTSAVANACEKKYGKEHRIDWVAVARLVQGRTQKQYWSRWRSLDPSIDGANRRTGAWAEDEDTRLKNAVQTHTLRQETEAMSAAHEAALQQKETAIKQSLAKLKEELDDRKILEETIDALQKDKAAAQRQLDDARETTTRLVSENEKFQQTVQTLGSERNTLLETTKNLETEKEDLNGKNKSLQAELDRSASALHQSNKELVKECEDQELQDLNWKVKFLASSESNVLLQTQVGTLATQLAERNQERDDIQSELEASNEKVDEMEATIAGIKVVTSEQLKSLSIERDAALEQTKELETQLGSAAEERDTARSELKTSLAKVVELAATIDSLEASARETSLQVESLSGEKELEAGTITIAELKDDPKASVTPGATSETEVPVAVDDSFTCNDDEDDDDDGGEDDTDDDVDGGEDDEDDDDCPRCDDGRSDSSMAKDSPTKGQKWTDEEDDDKMEAAVNKQGSIKSWVAIAALFPGRTRRQCNSRWTYLNKKKSESAGTSWTPDEVKNLTKAKKSDEGTDWKAVADNVASRDPDQCRLKWKSLLESGQVKEKKENGGLRLACST